MDNKYILNRLYKNKIKIMEKMLRKLKILKRNAITLNKQL